MMKTIFKIIIILVCLSSFKIAFAQKNSGVEVGNLWLNNGKVNGRRDDWKLPLKAFNKVTRIWYSIANDDDKLYLVVHTTRGGKVYPGGH